MAPRCGWRVGRRRRVARRRRGPTITSNRMHAGVLNFRNYLVAIFCAHSLFASFLSLILSSPTLFYSSNHLGKQIEIKEIGCMVLCWAGSGDAAHRWEMLGREGRPLLSSGILAFGVVEK